jgi:hypothetical protein
MGGRKKKYQTDEERRIASCEKSKRYYEKNKEKIKKKNLEKYYESKRNKTMA